MAMSQADVWLRYHFPNLRSGHYTVTSQDTNDYNCLAWAMDETDRKWDPNDPDHYWPDGVAREQTIPAFIPAFATKGYSRCDNGESEIGYEKIAIYGVGQLPKHAAKQLVNGAWTSKLGDGWDIEHPTLNGVDSPDYGSAMVFMKRPTAY